MHFRRAQQKLLAAIAALVMTFASLAPAWAAAISGAPGVAGWVELCSADGAKRIAVDANGDPVSSEPSKHKTSGEHCPFCNLQQTPATLPPAPTQVVPQTVEHATFPALFYAATRPSHAWAPSRSRAPPELA
jgi:hypothetical protein